MTDFCFRLLVAGFILQQIAVADEIGQLYSLNPTVPARQISSVVPTAKTQSVAAQRLKRANFKCERASIKARQMADWVVASGDNQRLPFVIVDKTDGRVFVFHPDGRLRGAAAALLGMAIGDDAVAGINDRTMASIRPEERITPTGRFLASLGRNMSGTEILWVDYDAAISLHRVVTTKRVERRLERLSSITPLDNRISYGCINVPIRFYLKVVRPAFTGTNGIVYVLPETRSAHEVFGSYDVDNHGAEDVSVGNCSASEQFRR